jgi:7-cyano-7-deazaguanine reductase
MPTYTSQTDLADLTLLGQDETQPTKTPKTFPNHNPERDYIVTLKTDDFTCVCPMTGQPDFARLTIRYTPDQRMVESKSFKLYFWSYRNEGVFHEHVTNLILDDLVQTLAPRWCEVVKESYVVPPASRELSSHEQHIETRRQSVFIDA